jgi:hypothetical protein
VKRVRHLTSVHVVGESRILYRKWKGLADVGFDIALIARPPGSPVTAARAGAPAAR